ncbi:hypothetical protein ACIBQX_28060 [Nonomuraea sp. NPDC049714]|uniref:hypothetical protein n=1 Tax=Nonomuraea sp. NPDC049714 TaxID=3364357 RepID=UPI0037A7B8F2
MNPIERERDPVTGLEIAMEWAKLPPEYLATALGALEPELARQHEYRMTRDARAHARHMAGLIAGFVVCIATLSAAIVLGLNGEVWLAAILAGPSAAFMLKTLVLRKANTTDIKEFLRRSNPPPAEQAAQLPPP